MKKLSLSVVVLVFLLLSSRQCSAQTVEYSFQNRDTITGALPFDRKFGFKFTHIDTSRVNAIVVRIYEVGVTNYKKILHSASYARRQAASRTPKIPITNQDILDAGGSLIMQPDSIVKYTDFADSTAYMKSLITLRPSSDYFIEVKAYESKPLSEKEKRMLTKKIGQDPMFIKVINAFAYQNIDESLTTFESLDELSDSLNIVVKNVVHRAGAQYNYHPVDVSEPLAHLFTDISNVGSSLDDISQTFKKRDKDKSLSNPDSVIGILKRKLLKTDWTNIIKDTSDEDYKEISAIVNAQKKTFAALPNDFSASANLDRIMKDIDAAIDHKQVVLDTLIKKSFVQHIDKGSAVAATYPKEFLKQAGEFIRSDLGLAYVWGIGRVNPYVAAQISLGPLDDSIPLRQYSGFGNVMRSRLSFMIGISVDAIAKDSVRRGVIGSQALILGTGFKLWQWLKVNSGFYLYYGEPRNPLQERSRLTFKGSPFVSLSIDIRIQSLLNGVGNAIFKTQTP